MHESRYEHMYKQYIVTGIKTQEGYIKTHGSESRGQEEAVVRDERVSYLHVALL